MDPHSGNRSYHAVIHSERTIKGSQPVPLIPNRLRSGIWEATPLIANFISAATERRHIYFIKNLSYHLILYIYISFSVNGSAIVIHCAEASPIPAYKVAVPSPCLTRPPLNTTSSKSGLFAAAGRKSLLTARSFISE